MLEIKGNFCKDVKIFTDNIEEAALTTIYNIANNRSFEGKSIRIMPDVHDGKGIVVGFSCPVNIETDFVNPEHIGCDIGCTISATFFDGPVSNVPLLEHRIREVIPFGFELNNTSKTTWQTIANAVNKAMDRLVSRYPIFKDYIIRFNTEKDLVQWCERIRLPFGVFMQSIGTVGGGNHFVEYDYNEELGKYCICVHCGSRRLGMAVFNYWNKIAKTMAMTKEEKRQLLETVKANNTNKKMLNIELEAAKNEYLMHRRVGYLNDENLLRYLVDVLIAQVYAKINHNVIHSQITEIYKRLSNASVTDYVETTHNYIDYDFEALLGTTNMMMRKGAIRAYKGERCIIPFNMRDGIAICEGKSNEDWNYTAPHGAGRIMSRSKANTTLNVEEFVQQMDDAGIYTTTANAQTLDEAPNAYKPMNEIVKLIEPTVDILYFMKPKMNIKASETL